MSTYLVAGGIFQDFEGNEMFTLVCPSSGELPYIMKDSIRSYFKLIWQNAHLYQVEDDYTLTLVDLSPEALQWGVKAPKKVKPDRNLCEKLKTAFQTMTS